MILKRIRHAAAPFLGAAVLLAVPFAPIHAQEQETGKGILLSQPIDCTLGEDCYLQALFDHDPTSESGDFSCGTLTRNDHEGSDFALPNLQAMRDGVNVLSAAPGTVVGIRNVYPDIPANAENAPDIGTQFCGNGVAISHGDGWITQYCHMKLDSIRVQEGQRVAKGTPLGEVGLSGMTTFPHLHLTVLRDGHTDVDPFAPDGPTCNAAPTRTLWQDPLLLKEGGFYVTGFAKEVPSFDAMKDDLQSDADLSIQAPIVAWVSGFGVQAGDVLTTEINGPGGIFHRSEQVFEKRLETWQRFTGRNFTTFTWEPGPYVATFTLTRTGRVLDTQTITAIAE